MSPINFIRQFIKSYQLMTELNQASGKVLISTLSAGHACARDLKSFVPYVEIKHIREGFDIQANMWLETTASVSGLVEFRTELIDMAKEREQEIQRLRELCLKHGVDATDPEEIPF